MNLAEWMTQNNVSVSRMRELAGVANNSVIYRYLNGRTPVPEVIRKIQEVTVGAVTANDFITPQTENGPASPSSARRAS